MTLILHLILRIKKKTRQFPIYIFLDRKELLTVKTRTLKNVKLYVSTHNPQNPEINNVIRKNLPILEEDPDMKKMLDNSQNIKVKDKVLILKQFLQEHFSLVKLK